MATESGEAIQIALFGHMIRAVGAGAWFAASIMAILVVDRSLKAHVLASAARVHVGGRRVRPSLSPGTVAGRLGLGPAGSVVVLACCLAVVLVAVVRTGAFGGTLAPVALGCAVGGALSNVIDVARRGGVVDYVRLGRWPAFNLADVAIVAGVIGALVAR